MNGKSTAKARLRVGPFDPQEIESARKLRELPSPPGLPLFGNALSVQPKRAIEIFERWASELGALCSAHFPLGSLLMITDPELNETMLRARPSALRRFSMIEPIFEELGARGVFSTEGETWKAQRRLVMEALSQRHLRSFFPTLRRVTERLLGLWMKAADEELIVEPTSDLMRYTTDVTVSLAFGTDMNSIEEGGQLLQEHLSLVFPAIGRRLNAVFPYWRYFRMPSDRKLDRALRHIRQVQEELLAQARERVGKRAHGDGDGSSHDMLEAMLMARDEDGQPYDDEAIYGNMLTMLLAGEDTTAYAISWALHFLADRPKLMDALCEEVEQRSADSVLSDLNAAAPLPLVDAVAQETLRLKSPAPAAPLGALVDLMVDDVFVPAGTAIQLMTRLPTLDPDRFAAPDEFRPERWLDGGDSTGPHDVRSHIPFGSGPRICPGRSLALLEMRLVLSMLAKNFRLKRVGSPDEVQERTAFVLTPVGIRVMMIPRSDHR